MGITSGTLLLTGARHTPFDETIRLAGINLTGAAMEAHLRLGFDAPGAPLVDLDLVTTTNTQGLRLVKVATEDGIIVSYVQMHINQATMKSLPAATERGADLALAYDLHLTPVAGSNPDLPPYKQVYLRGPFIIQAGATQ